MKIKYLTLLAVSGTIIALDQVTKLIIHTRFHLGELVPVIQNYFNITYVRNYGAAFGIFSQFPAGFREPFFAMIPLIALIAIMLILRTTKDNDYWQILALSLIFGGAIGNYIDRIRFKFVIDFLDFHWNEQYHWPSFNVADSAIVCGVTILFLQMMFSSQSLSTTKKAS